MNMEKKSKILLLAVLSLLLLVGLSSLFLWQLWKMSKETNVVFLNIGQGDAILISQGKYQILIDGGRSGKDLLAHLGRHIPFWDRKIEIVIATHPDTDHIGGFPALLRAYQVERLLTTGAEGDTETSRLFQAAILQYLKHEPTKIFQGTTITFPFGGVLMVEYPFGPLPKESTDTNAGSIVSRFVYGETSFLLTGDLAAEETVLPQEQAVSVLKVAHHGSRFSTSEAFLLLTRPKEAVISVGKNSYGHPNQGVLDRLQKVGAHIRRTDEQGDIRYRCLESMMKCVFVE